MRTPDPRGVTATQASVEEEIESQALACAELPPSLETGNFLIGPCVESVSVVDAGKERHAARRIRRDELAVDGPAEEPPHRLEPVVRAVRLFLAPIHTFLDRAPVDVGEALVPRDRHHGLEQAVSLGARGP